MPHIELTVADTELQSTIPTGTLETVGAEIIGKLKTRSITRLETTD